MIGPMVAMLMVFFMCDELGLVLWGVGPILRNGHGRWGQALKGINKVILEQNGDFILVCYLVDLN